MLFVVDWSHWQAPVCPVDKIVNEGFSGVKLKCGGGQKPGDWSFLDPSFARSWQAVLDAPVLPCAYWYLAVDNPRAQAGLFVDTLERCGGYDNWACFLDVEQPGVTGSTVFEFWQTWQGITATHPLALYTRKDFWRSMADPMPVAGPILFPFLEEAHWVAQSVRDTLPYASQQVHGLDPDWWNVRYGAGEWDRASMIQFTDRASVAGHLTTVSAYNGTLKDLRKALMA